MKKVSALRTTILIAAGLFLSVALIQCTKVGVTAKKLDRSFNGVPDSAVFSPFYDVTRTSPSDVNPTINDSIVVKGVLSTIKEYCGVATCHGGPISPKLSTYTEITKYVSPGNPGGSKLWELITTNELNKTMPPVNATHELSTTDKTIIYNWIKNGAKEYPDLVDFRPAAIKAIITGCTSGNCHSVITSTGSWARALMIGGLDFTRVPPDTTVFKLIRASGITPYCQLSNVSIRDTCWANYKDSVRKFYKDTTDPLHPRPYKTFSTPVVKSNVRGPLSSYDDILLDIIYPKSARSSGSVKYTNGSGIKFYVQGDNLNVTSSLISRIDSTIILANPRTGVWNNISSGDGDMAWNDGGFTRTDIALVKAWYFADPNIPDVWKYGLNNTGIFKYKRSQTVIIKH